MMIGMFSGHASSSKTKNIIDLSRGDRDMQKRVGSLSGHRALTATEPLASCLAWAWKDVKRHGLTSDLMYLLGIM